MSRDVLLVYLWGLVICTFNVQCNETVRESRIVRTTQGPVRGYKDPEGDFYVFYNIPYAKAPTGPSKYKAPLPPPVWLETFDAVDKGVICPQGKILNIGFTNKTMQEDCLIVNVYAPETDETNLPVVVYVHGGAYLIGFGELGVPRSLVQSKKIIAVNFNYRLGVHGFLCLGTEDIPGNAGMKDQVALLRWVKNNIAKFGGNPDDVTIAGYSAGSSAVDLLMLSASTKGLYNKVIPESGANVGVWSIQLDPTKAAKSYAKQYNFNDVDDIYALENFYKTTPLDQLNTNVVLNTTDSNFLFSPCVERDTTGEAFLIDYPVNILKQGKYRKVPILYGFANMEGLFRIGDFEHWKDKMNENFSEFLPADLEFKSNEQKIEVANIIKEFYFGDKPVGEESIRSYVDYFTDVLFAYPTLRSTKLQVDAGNDAIYLYEYSFVVDELNINLPEVAQKRLRGANHAAQTAAILNFDLPYMNFNESENYKKMKELMSELWINFITTGTPVPEGSSLPVPSWPPANASRSPHMSLGETIELKGPLLEERARFWDRIYDEYYRIPKPPSPPLRIKHSEL